MNMGGLMTRSSSAVERDPDRVSGGGSRRGALTSAGRSREDRLRVVDGHDQSPEDETPPVGDLRLMFITASGFKVPLVATPAQAARLLRSCGETDAADQSRKGDPAVPMSRRMDRPRPVPVDRLLSRGRLVSRVETPLGGGAA